MVFGKTNVISSLFQTQIFLIVSINKGQKAYELFIMFPVLINIICISLSNGLIILFFSNQNTAFQ